MDCNLLYIDTSTKVCSVGVAVNGAQGALHETGDGQYEHGEKITLLIQQALIDAKLKMSDLHGVCLTSGPGSYTGLRIGASTAKGICYALNIPLITIDALTSLAVQAQSKYPNHTLCAMIDARRMEVFSAIYSPSLELLKGIASDVLDENSYLTFENMVVFGDGAEKTKEIFNNRNYIFDLDIKSSVKGIFKLGYEKFVSGDFADAAYFEPLYVKEFFSTAKKG